MYWRPHISGTVLGIWSMLNEWDTLIYIFKSLPVTPRDSEVEKIVFSVITRKFDKFLVSGENNSLTLVTKKKMSEAIPGE